MTPPRRKKGLLAALHTESFDLLLFIVSETPSWALGSQVEETFGQEARECRLCVCVFLANGLWNATRWLWLLASKRSRAFFHPESQKWVAHSSWYRRVNPLRAPVSCIRAVLTVCYIARLPTQQVFPLANLLVWLSVSGISNLRHKHNNIFIWKQPATHFAVSLALCGCWMASCGLGASATVIAQFTIVQPASTCHRSSSSCSSSPLQVN